MNRDDILDVIHQTGNEGAAINDLVEIFGGGMTQVLETMHHDGDILWRPRDGRAWSLCLEITYTIQTSKETQS